MNSTQPTEPPSERGVKKLLLGIGDAAVPSLGTLAVSVAAAHAMPLPDFGAFSTMLLALIMVVGVSRSMHGDVLVLTASRDPDDQTIRIRQSLSSVLVTGLGLGLLTVVVGGVLAARVSQSPWGPAIAAAGIVLPVVLLQDHHRWIAYTRGRIQDSVINNVAWVLVSSSAVTFLGLRADGQLTASAGLLVWGGAALAGVIVGTALDGAKPSVRQGGAWLRDNRRLATSLTQDFGLLQASAQGALILLAALTSAADIGLLRKAQLWLGPVTMLTTGLLSALQSLLARRHDSERPAASTRFTVLVSSVAAVSTVAYGMLVFVLPADVAALLASDDWSGARVFVWPLTLQLAMGLLGGCLGVALRVRGQVAQQVRARWVLAPTSLVVVVVAATTSGALAAAWGLAAIAALTAAIWWYFLAASPTALVAPGEIPSAPARQP